MFGNISRYYHLLIDVEFVSDLEVEVIRESLCEVIINYSFKNHIHCQMYCRNCWSHKRIMFGGAVELTTDEKEYLTMEGLRKKRFTGADIYKDLVNDLETIQFQLSEFDENLILEQGLGTYFVTNNKDPMIFLDEINLLLNSNDMNLMTKEQLLDMIKAGEMGIVTTDLPYVTTNEEETDPVTTTTTNEEETDPVTTTTTTNEEGIINEEESDPITTTTGNDDPNDEEGIVNEESDPITTTTGDGDPNNEGETDPITTTTDDNNNQMPGKDALYWGRIVFVAIIGFILCLLLVALLSKKPAKSAIKKMMRITVDNVTGNVINRQLL